MANDVATEGRGPPVITQTAQYTIRLIIAYLLFNSTCPVGAGIGVYTTRTGTRPEDNCDSSCGLDVSVRSNGLGTDPSEDIARSSCYTDCSSGIDAAVRSCNELCYGQYSVTVCSVCDGTGIQRAVQQCHDSIDAVVQGCRSSCDRNTFGSDSNHISQGSGIASFRVEGVCMTYGSEDSRSGSLRGSTGWSTDSDEDYESWWSDRNHIRQLFPHDLARSQEQRVEQECNEECERFYSCLSECTTPCSERRDQAREMCGTIRAPRPRSACFERVQSDWRDCYMQCGNSC